ncbi:MAG TPA: hypothetical protein VJR87_05540 [Allosphingosinicella sp.]|nr:hypothetical protein [Allosphingosinicella sp.]
MTLDKVRRLEPVELLRHCPGGDDLRVSQICRPGRVIGAGSPQYEKNTHIGGADSEILSHETIVEPIDYSAKPDRVHQEQIVRWAQIGTFARPGIGHILRRAAELSYALSRHARSRD